ncbi:MAG TPA: hypothetical protein VJV79_37035 [Polyangiaceae bacterium]|nr:hypothetical protein [Polyangiaceae bacterium]
MNKLSIVGIGALLIAAGVVGCSSDEDSPGKGSAGGPSSAGNGGSGGAGKAGAANKAGADNTPSEGGEGGKPVEGGAGEGGAAGGGNPTETCDVYGDRENGKKEIPHDAEGNITLDHLTSDTIWKLEGRWFVKPGHTLTIDPCTLIEATPTPNAGSLFVPQGAKINAAGKKDAPIVFTTQTHELVPGAPWGGIVLLGKAPVARLNETPTYLRQYEGYVDPRATFGLANPADFDENDDSGVLQFVRIEYSGDIIVTGKEINGLSFCGVGAGTTIDHIQVKDQQDDCFEWFGGTMNASHLICQNSGDDMFDADLGYKGHLQYLFGRNLFEGSSGDPTGFEWDGDQDDLAVPADEASAPKVSNATICGVNMAGLSSSYGSVIRRNVAPGTSIMNTIFTGWSFGLDLRNHVGTNAEPLVSLTESIFFGQVSANGQSPSDDDSSPTDGTSGSAKGDYAFIEDTYLGDAANAVTLGGDAPVGFDCYSEVPSAPSAAIAGGTPAAPFDKSAKFVGAGSFDANGWQSGSWISWK